MATYQPEPDATSLDLLPTTIVPSASNQKHKTISSSVLNNKSGERNSLLN
jgi:hypothetical protein